MNKKIKSSLFVMGGVIVFVSCLLFSQAAQALISETPSLPLVYLDTTMPTQTGSVITVNTGGNLQTAINNATCGDTISIEATATFTGNFTLPNKPCSGWVVIRSSAINNLPATGYRVSPNHAVHMPNIVSPNSGAAIATQASAHNYRLIGLEVYSTHTLNYGLVTLGDSTQNSMSMVPTDLVLDRMYIHGNPTITLSRGVGLNSARTSIIDSYISEAHGVGAETQAIGGWNGPGPFKIVNNYLEGATENFMLGGADPAIPNLVPSDIEFRNNYLFKPLSWWTSHQSYAGQHWSVKNLFELKNAQRVLIEGNVMENNWTDAQAGVAVLFTPRNQSGGCSWCVVQDVTYRKNILKSTMSAFNITGRDSNYISQATKRIAIEDNLIYDLNSPLSRGFAINVMNIGEDNPTNIRIEHNTLIHSSTGSTFLSLGDCCRTGYFTFQNNLVTHANYGMFGNAVGTGAAAMNTYTNNGTFDRNVIITSGSINSYPSGNLRATSMDAVGFTNHAAANYSLTSSSPYRNAGTDGRDIGADFTALNTATQYTISGQAGVIVTPVPPVPTPTPTPTPTPSPTPTSTPTPTPSGTQAPYGGTAWAIPGTIQAENYDTGGNNIAYYDVESSNLGGNVYRTSEGVDVEVNGIGNYKIGFTKVNEWMEYTVNVATAGSYDVTIRVSNSGAGGSFHLEVDGVNATGAITIPNTGAWTTWSNITAGIPNLTAGSHVIRLFQDTAATNTFVGNFDYMTFTLNTPAPTPTPTPIPTPSVTPIPTPLPTPDMNGWTFCAYENQTCSFSETRQVRYGAGDTYAYVTATSSVSCINAVFGDPITGVAKQCHYSNTAMSTPTPTPTPSTTMTPAPTASFTPTPTPTSNPGGPTPSITVSPTPKPDRSAPYISRISVTGKTPFFARINWTTNEPATSQVEFCTTSKRCGNNTPVLENLKTVHAIELYGLRPGTRYYFWIKSKDAAGNLRISGRKYFTTPK